jgi:hypothetical protein
MHSVGFDPAMDSVDYDPMLTMTLPCCDHAMRSVGCGPAMHDVGCNPAIPCVAVTLPCKKWDMTYHA